MSPARRRLWFWVKLALALAVVVGVGWQFARTLRNPALHDFQFVVRYEYLIPAGLLYLCCHTIWGTFWVQLLHAEGAVVSWRRGIAAYFVSQFGKYVPGKVWVILLRVGYLRNRASKSVVAVTGVIETFTSMAAGAILGAIFLSGVVVRLIEAELGRSVGGAAWWIGLGMLGLMPVAVFVLTRVADRAVKRAMGPDARPLPTPSARLLARGLLQDAAGWCLLGISFGLVVRGLAPHPPEWTWDHFAEDLGAVAASYVAGFVLLIAPGGLGAREWVLKLAVADRFADSMGVANAAAFGVVVALVLRLVWTLFEVVFAGSLWWRGHKHT
ncbi:MAG TPA: lysylphosphatidylglycerol synthase domain-containing protein [Fimbriiglobus sp.]|jgi:hypothetical protein